MNCNINLNILLYTLMKHFHSLLSLSFLLLLVSSSTVEVDFRGSYDPEPQSVSLFHMDFLKVIFNERPSTGFVW